MQEIKASIFRAYDIRGIYPSEINEPAAKAISEKIEKNFFKKGKITVAYDARNSSYSIYKAVIEGLSKKREIVKIGPSTTPMFYYFTIAKKAAGGIMVTASHNPPEWNGLKVVGPNASPVSGFDIYKIIKK